MNSVNIIGNLVSDPIIRGTDKKVANFTVAVRGNKEHTDFIRCTAFGKTAEIVEQYYKKGARVGVVGSIHVGSYEKDGNKVTTTEVYANNVELLSNKASEKAEAPAPTADFAELPDDDEVLPFN